MQNYIDIFILNKSRLYLTGVDISQYYLFDTVLPLSWQQMLWLMLDTDYALTATEIAIICQT